MDGLGRWKIVAWSALVCLALGSCGGNSPTVATGSSSGTTTVTSSPNVASVTVDSGPGNAGAPNTLYTTVTVCVPGSTTECQKIDHIQVDTGSSGLRVLASVLTLSLPVNAASDGNSLVECAQFVSGYSWGPVVTADVKIAGESAASVPIQVIGSSAFSTVPAACSNSGPAQDTVAQFGANGVLGIAVFAQDCGATCATSPSNGFYYSCSSTVCNPSTAILTAQVLNVVPLFATDNNGTVLVLPSVPAAGEATLSGSLIFGIDTQANNASGSQTVLTLDAGGNFTTDYQGAPLSASFLDTGTNGIYFNDSTLPTCTANGLAEFYCPATVENRTAVLKGLNNASANVNFSIANAETLLNANATFNVLGTLGGTYSSSTTTFDWGLPFYYGRTVYTALEGYTTTVQTGPYVAF